MNLPLARRLRGRATSLAAALLVPVFWLLIACMPWWMLRRISPVVGRLLRAGVREPILRNMRAVLGPDECAPDRMRDLWDAHVGQVGLTAVEAIRFSRMTDRELIETVALDGEEHLRRSLANGRGVILFINHLGHMGCVPAALGPRGYRSAISGNSMPLKFLERKVAQLYARGGAARLLVGDGLPHTISSTLKSGNVVALFIDFPVVRKHTCWIEFGPASMEVNIAPAMIALRNDVDVLCVKCVRIPGDRHRVVIRPPIRIDRTGDLRRDSLQLLHRAMDQLYVDLQSHPEQWWLWDYARLSSRNDEAGETPDSRTVELPVRETLHQPQLIPLSQGGLL